MKLTILAITLVVLAFGFVFAQKNSVRQTEVTSGKIAQQPAGQPYVINIARGEVYNLAPGVDFSRIRLRTSAGEKALSSLANRFRTDRNVLIGSFEDLSSIDFGFPTGIDIARPDRISGAQCDKQAGVCGCTGKKDCGDLGRSGKCSSGTVSCGTWGVGPDKGKRGCVCLMKA